MNSTPETVRPPRLCGTLPDAETPRGIYILTGATGRRPTYQVRMLAAKAATTGKELVLQVPRTCVFDRSLAELMQREPHLIRREDLP